VVIAQNAQAKDDDSKMDFSRQRMTSSMSECQQGVLNQAIENFRDMDATRLGSVAIACQILEQLQVRMDSS
jgi:hypothetical protein